MGEVNVPRRESVRLEFADGRVIPPHDLDAYSVSAARAAEAYRGTVRADEQIRHYESQFLLTLHRWCVQHAAKVRACVVPLPNRYMQVFVVTISPRYDFALGDELAALELQLARAGWRVEVSQLPAMEESSLAAFFKSDGALEFSAQRETVLPEDEVRRNLEL